MTVGNDGALLGLTVLVANPSPDVYGSDLQMLESISAIVDAGGHVVVALPEDGALVPMIRQRGGRIEVVAFPVLRRANQSARTFLTMAGLAVGAVPRLVRSIRHSGASLVYVNTITLPWWLLAARLTRTPVVCHLHEAENTDSGLVQRALVTPLRLAQAVIVISRSAMTAMTEADPSLGRRAHLIYNGVPGPEEIPEPTVRHNPVRVVVVGRLSPRKAPHLALEAVARLRERGYDLQLELAGSAYTGYEWYVRQLEERATQPDLAGAVSFAGYRTPIWPTLHEADIVVAPSLREPFGNAVVEAQLALRPVVATAALGHLESITNEETGLLVPVEDVEAMAEAIARLVDEPDLASDLTTRARQSALARFSTRRYDQEVVALLASLLDRAA